MFCMLICCCSEAVVLRLFCELAYTKTTAPRAKNNTVATDAIFKLVLIFLHHHEKQQVMRLLNRFSELTPIPPQILTCGMR